MATLKLLRLRCTETEDSWGSDEAYLTVNEEKVWGPAKINDGKTKDINVDYQFSQTAWVRLYDEDSPDSDDSLGEIEISASQAGTGEQRENFIEDDANYTLYYEVIV